ncbi:kinesin-domain-containing protein [Apiospora arundinis]
MAKGDLVDEIQWLGIPDPKKQSSLHSGEVPPPSWHGAFERVFDTSATNADVFDEVKPVISSAFSGRSVCVFAYGQSGSGKTYTLGTAAATVSLEEGGVIPRSMDMLADFIEKRKDTWMYSVEVEFLEIYNEDVFDLLPEKRTKAAIKYNSEYYFADSRHVELTHEGALDMKMVQSVLQGAADKRKVGATVKNNQSSRSHSLLTLRITGKLRGGTADGQEQVTHGVLNLVDLAGSEKYTNTAASSTSKEGININNSLMVLRKVIGSMADPKTKHTGYRESTLTKLLEPCLGQGCRVIMLAMVSPLIRDREESRNTLRFAASATEARMQNVRAPDNLSGSTSSSSAASNTPSSARQSGLPKPKSTPGGAAKPPIGRNGSVQRTPPGLSIPRPSAMKGRSGIASPLSGGTSSPRTATSQSLNALRATNVESATRSRNDLGKQPLPRLERRSSTPPVSPSSFRERIASAQGNRDVNDDDTPPTPTPTSATGRLPRPPSKLGRSNAVRRPSQAGRIPRPAQ